MHFTLNAILILGLGLLMIVSGVYVGASFSYMRMMAIGLLLTGIGCIFCGLTDGFADPTPRGYAFRKIGYTAFALGIPALIYATYYFI